MLFDKFVALLSMCLMCSLFNRFGHCTVSMAHHVINIWFIHCRLPFRKLFVKYIVRVSVANISNCAF